MSRPWHLVHIAYVKPAKRPVRFAAAYGEPSQAQKGNKPPAPLLPWALVVAQEPDRCEYERRPAALAVLRTVLSVHETREAADAERHRLLEDEGLLACPETLHAHERTTAHLSRRAGWPTMWWCDEHEHSEATAWAALEAARLWREQQEQQAEGPAASDAGQRVLRGGRRS